MKTEFKLKKLLKMGLYHINSTSDDCYYHFNDDRVLNDIDCDFLDDIKTINKKDYLVEIWGFDMNGEIDLIDDDLDNINYEYGEDIEINIYFNDDINIKYNDTDTNSIVLFDSVFITIDEEEDNIDEYTNYYLKLDYTETDVLNKIKTLFKDKETVIDGFNIEFVHLYSNVHNYYQLQFKVK